MKREDCSTTNDTQGDTCVSLIQLGNVCITLCNNAFAKKYNSRSNLQLQQKTISVFINKDWELEKHTCSSNGS